MGKSLGNFITIKDFLKDNSAENLRYLVTTGHYRKPQNYTKKAVEDAENTIKKLNAFIKRLQNVDNTSESKLAEPIIENTIFNFSKAMDDDLNTPMALSEIHFLVKEINKLIEKNSITTQQAKRILEFLIKVNLVFKFLSFKSQEDDSCKKPQIPREEILNLIEKRKKLRKEKKWEEADQIRVKLSQKGIVLYDNKDETTWTQE
ncbi:MAG: DALR domain-containing protein [archaeon]